MKCTNCGFTYDEEAFCPICGTPAAPEQAPAYPYPAPAPHAPAAPYAPVDYASPVVPAPNAAPVPEDAPAPAEPAPEKACCRKQHTGLKIATLCVLAVIAAALVYNAVIQTLRFQHENKYDSLLDRAAKYTDEMLNGVEALKDGSPFGNILSDDANPYDDTWDWLPAYGDEKLTDDKTHAIGESYDFGRGVVTLKSAAVTKKDATYDDKLQQVALTIELTNNTKEDQIYEAPAMMLNGTEYDYTHFVFAEDSTNGEDVSYSYSPGKSVSATYYYNLPKDSKMLDATVTVNGGDGEYYAETTYQFDTKDIG